MKFEENLNDKKTVGSVRQNRRLLKLFIILSSTLIFVAFMYNFVNAVDSEAADQFRNFLNHPLVGMALLTGVIYFTVTIAILKFLDAPNYSGVEIEEHRGTETARAEKIPEPEPGEYGHRSRPIGFANEDDTKNRIFQEINALRKRGNLNLALGAATTVIGLAFLGLSLTQIPKELEDVLAFYGPRVTLVLLVEVFAYFFLRLYKSSSEEIKFFQNELTTIEMKFSALQLAKEFSDKGTLKYVLKELAKTERNPSPHQSTQRDGEKNQNALLDAIKALTAALKANK